MSDQLRSSDLRDIVAALQDITELHSLGLELNIDSSKLKEIERNHLGDLNRQKTEVIEYWLRNSRDASYTTLANAVERMGGYARLAERLSKLGKEKQRDEQPSHEGTPQRKATRTHSLNSCEKCNILILGKAGDGKSMLGNRISNSDGNFKLNCGMSPQTCVGVAVINSETRSKNYLINIYDHNGLFEGVCTMRELSSIIPSSLNLVLFVLKSEHRFNQKEREILKAVTSEWQISRISAVVLTHCEGLSEEKRAILIGEFKKDHPSIAELMGKGIYAVGFPDSSLVKGDTELSISIEDDKAKLRKLIYSCDEPVHIFCPGSRQLPPIEQSSILEIYPPRIERRLPEIESGRAPQTENRQLQTESQHVPDTQPPQTDSGKPSRCSLS